MTHKIIVGVDGSDPSIEAMRWAAYEARRRNFDILTVSCLGSPAHATPSDATLCPTREDFETFADSAATVVGHAAQMVAEIDSQLIVDGVTTTSPPAIGIPESAEAGDEIVVGASGHTGFFDGLLGSVAMSVVHRAQVPVIVVPAKPVADVGPMMHKIVVGLDGSAASLEALEWAYDEAELSGAELTAVHGWIYPYAGARTSVSEPRDQMQLDAMEELKTSLESLGSRLTSGSIHVHAKLVERSPAEALLGEAANADLVVIGSSGRGAMRSALLGSVSRTVLQHAPCPVVVTPHG